MIGLDNPECVVALRELRRNVLKLTVVSHAPIQGYELAPTNVGRGDRWRLSDRKPPVPHLGLHQAKGGDTSIPRGKVDVRGDRSEGYRQKSATYFQRRLNHMERVSAQYGPIDLWVLALEAETAVSDWRRTPIVSGGKDLEPQPKTFFWKCAIADDDRHIDDIVSFYKVSRTTVYRYRASHRGLRKSVVEARKKDLSDGSFSLLKPS